jgi:hypothetical protein
MKRKYVNLVIAVTMVMALFVAQPAYADGRAPIDLSRDDNGNQIADAIEKEVAFLQTLPSVEEQSKEIKGFVGQLPISVESQKLQNRAQVLSTQLQVASPEQATKILKELADISGQLNADPTIAKTLSDLQKLMGNAVIPDPNALNSSRVTPFAPAYGSLKKGDILAKRSGIFVLWPWAMTYEHTGNLYDTNNVFESNQDGVRLKPISDWKKPGTYVGLARNNKVTSTNMAAAVEWAANKYGTNGRTPYNYNFIDKQTDAKLYCSQLSWKISKNKNVDLDSNAWQYHLWASVRYGVWIIAVITPAVAPDEVMLDGDVTVYSTGWN